MLTMPNDERLGQVGRGAGLPEGCKMTTYNENQKYKALLRAVANYWFANGQDSTLDRYMISYSGRDWKIDSHC